MLRIQGLILVLSAYCLLVLWAIFMPVYKWASIPAGVLIAVVIYYRQGISHREKIEIIHKRLSNLRSEGLIIDEKFKEAGGDVFYSMILTLLTDLERSLFKLVEKNIQLLSIKEIGRSIVTSTDEDKLIDSVFEYLVHGVGYRETAFVLLRKSRKCFQAIVCIENSNRLIRKVVNLDYEDLKGAVFNAFTSGKAFLIKDARMHPIFENKGEQMFPKSTMTSYICVPLQKSSERNRCCSDENCRADLQGKSADASAGRVFMSHPECLSCPENSILGAIIVTDGFRATPLTNIDLVTIETVGSLVGSNIENWLLYEELREEEIFREKVLEGMQHGLFVCDLEGSITLANRSALEMCKWGEDKVLGAKIGDLISRGSGGSSGSFIFEILEQGGPPMFHEAYMKQPDGLHIPIRMYVSRLMGNEGKKQGAIILFVDLSDIRNMEKQIRHLDTLAALGRFTSAVAHEIRNPLTGIAAGIQYLERKGGLTDDQRENISIILMEVDRLNRIITDLFKVAKPRDLLYQEVSVKGLIDRSYKSVMEILNNKRIEFETEIADNLPVIEVDHDQILQVFINLIKNAAEAVPDGGKVMMTAAKYGGGVPEVIMEKDKTLVCFEISDNGPGIDRGDIGKIFEPFFSRKVGGTGLGLFISHNIVQHHQGRIDVSSKPGNGTSFKVYLPLKHPVKGGKVETGNTSG